MNRPGESGAHHFATMGSRIGENADRDAREVFSGHAGMPPAAVGQIDLALGANGLSGNRNQILQKEGRAHVRDADPGPVEQSLG